MTRIITALEGLDPSFGIVAGFVLLLIILAVGMRRNI